MASDEPIHKRLDALFRKPGCSPEDVVSLVSSLDPAGTVELVRNSFEIQKCYQLDFFYRCGKPELKWLMTSLMDSGNQTFQSHFMWQILTEDSSKAAFLKYDYRYFFGRWKKNATPHPYVYGHENYVRTLDAACREICRSKGDFAASAAAVGFFDPSAVGYSLFQGRLLSTDVFKAMEPVEQWKCLNALPRCGASMAFRSRFVFSMIEDPETTPEMKAATIRSMSAGVDPETCNLMKAMPEKVQALLNEHSSFGEFNLYRSVMQDTAVDRRLVMFLLYFRPAWLLEWYDVDGEEIDGVLRCRSTVEELVRTER